MQPSRYGHMVNEYYVQRLRVIAAERKARIAALRTREDAEAYVQQVRDAVRRSFGPLPARTPLNARITGRDEYRGYSLEKVIFESRPGFLVTGNMLLPKAASGPLPAVLAVCGHWGGGKSCEPYQSFCQGLAVKGFAVFIFDPIAQGERRQFYPDDGGKRPNLCEAHNLLGNQQVLVDDFFGTWRVWDAMRGLDYLMARAEVDTSRVGVTGNSGGGTLSTYLTALDPRLSMAAPSCFVCSYGANLENEIPADAEQNPPGILGAGLDEADFLMCYAPRPTIVLSQHDDFFDGRHAHGAYEDVRRVHTLLGSRASAAFFSGPCGHGYFQENREAMYGFFMKHAGVAGDARERGAKPVEERRLWATPRGQTRPLGSRRVFEFTAERAGELARERGKPSGTSVRRAAQKLLGVRAEKRAPYYRCLRGAGGVEQDVRSRHQFAVETEPGIQALVTTYGPEHASMHPPTGSVILYVGHTSGREDVRRVPEVRRLAGGRQSLTVVDPRGIGETMAATCGCTDFFQPYGSDYLYAATGEMLGESYLGRRVHDVMRTIDFLLAGGATRVQLMGRGVGSITAAFAALLHPSKPRVRLLHYLPSYDMIARSPHYAWPLSSLLRGCLVHFDLPDVYRALGKRLTKQEAWDAMMRGKSG